MMLLPLRTFPFDGDIISTFEQDPTCDPTTVKTADLKNIKFDTLFPEILPRPLRRNPVPSESRPASGEDIRGFVVHWSEPELPWLPYLPAVVTYHYPLFRNMNRSPKVHATEGGFVLDCSVVEHWSNVESVIWGVVQKLKPDASTTRHRSPFRPSSYGYRGTFRKRAAAKGAIKPSLLAFQHMLAYCSYLIASISVLHFPRNEHKSLYENPDEASTLFEKVIPNENQDSSHILLKLLWSTLGEIRQTRNFTGVAVRHDRPYGCQTVRDMYDCGVPVFIRWSRRFRFQTYCTFQDHHLLALWRPPADSFSALDQLGHSAEPHSNPPSPPPPPPAEPLLNPPSIQQPPPPPSTTPLDDRSDRCPWRYVESRKAAIASTSNKPGSWLDRDNSAKLFREPGGGGAMVYQFHLARAVDESTGKETQKWERNLLTRAEAQLLWDGVDRRNLWYDCAYNQWNHCYQFSFAENPDDEDEGDDDDDDDDDDVYTWGPLPLHNQNHSSPSPHRRCTLRYDEGCQMADDTPPQQGGIDPSYRDDMSRLVADVDTGMTHSSLPGGHDMADDPTEVPPFNGGAHLSQLLHTRHDASSESTSVWKDVGDFFYCRYGVVYISPEQDTDQRNIWSTRVGMKIDCPSITIVELYNSVRKGAWPSTGCDLSPDAGAEEALPVTSRNKMLRLTPLRYPEGYLITVVTSQQKVDWRLLIRDPLTLLQIEREGWDSDPCTLIINLIKKGVPFQILNPQKLDDAQFYDHPGPAVHPTGKPPQCIDYLAYRQELRSFFAHYPHAYAAALSAGGILWRIAMDVLPPPHEIDITRRFHPKACVSFTVEGQKYWFPQLTRLEEDVIVGVYKWRVSPQLSPQEDSWWPKPQVWKESGLDFGAWAPLDEDWYSSRCGMLDAGNAKCVRAKEWRAKIKYHAHEARLFLTEARSLADTFICQHRLNGVHVQ